MHVYGGIEAGGTKFVCAVGTGPDDVRAKTIFLTTTPAETLGRAVGFFRAYRGAGDLAAIGIGSFGPVDPNPASPTYGHITSTPKPGWQNVDVVGAVQGALDLPVAFDTDVNAACLGEVRWGAARGLDAVLYLTVGTGIGGGFVLDGRPLHGMMHPEMGHVRVPHDPALDPFPGCCPYHGDCLEGLVSGPAIEERWGQKGASLPPDHAAWPLVAEYLALALANYVCTLMPRRIVLGGGVMQQAQLFPMIRSRVQDLLHGYVVRPELREEIDVYIVPPGLGNRAGVLGAVALAAGARVES